MGIKFEIVIESYQGENGWGEPCDMNKITVRIAQDDTVLYHETTHTDDSIESVCGVRDQMAIAALEYAEAHLDYRATAEDYTACGAITA